MGKTYRTTGLILKATAFGEADRLLTILSPDHGIIRAIAPGARKHKSSLRGRCELFVVNDFFLITGRSLDRLTQVETQYSYQGLSQHLGKLAAGHYLAELALHLAGSGEPQPEIYHLLNEHLRRLEAIPPRTDHTNTQLLAQLNQGIFHLLAIAGIAPQVQRCCVGGQPFTVDFSPHFYGGFSIEAGGLIQLSPGRSLSEEPPATHPIREKPLKIDSQLNAHEINLLQHLGQKELPPLSELFPQLSQEQQTVICLRLENLLRDYIQYHCDRAIRSAQLLEDCIPLAF